MNYGFNITDKVECHQAITAQRKNKAIKEQKNTLVSFYAKYDYIQIIEQA